MKGPMTKTRIKRIKKTFQSLVMQMSKSRIVSFLEFEEKFNKLKDYNLKNTTSPRVYIQDVAVGWNIFGWRRRR